jgi:hypothetical protein
VPVTLTWSVVGAVHVLSWRRGCTASGSVSILDLERIREILALP